MLWAIRFVRMRLFEGSFSIAGKLKQGDINTIVFINRS